MVSTDSFYFSKDVKGIRAYQVHAVQVGHFEIREILNFRNYLREHPADVSEYDTLKRKLAANNSEGIAEYIQGKDAFIRRLITKAGEYFGVPDEG